MNIELVTGSHQLNNTKKKNPLANRRMDSFLLLSASWREAGRGFFTYSSNTASFLLLFPWLYPAD
jgi:hypothetical protein